MLRFDRPLVLASASPRRHELLAKLVAEFEVVVSSVDEDALTVADPYETARILALAKARAVLELRPDALVIGGDTVVTLEGEQLAKPVDEADAKRMLRRLSGKTHTVVTGVAVVTSEEETVQSAATEVTFRDLSNEDIDEYVATGEPMDKAGAYGIQAGAEPFVAKVEGSLTNVIGLPLEILQPMLARLSVPVVS